MNAIIGLALTCLLVGLLYVFMRQQFAAQDRKISDVTQLVASVVAELQQQLSPARPPLFPLSQQQKQEAQEPIPIRRSPERVTVSDDSESEGDTDAESDSESEAEDINDVLETCVDDVIRSKDDPVPIPVNSLELVEDDISIVLDLGEGTKTINLFETVEIAKKINYDKLTVKELKELANKHSAPASLKTKKELIEFLEKI